MHSQTGQLFDLLHINQPRPATSVRGQPVRLYPTPDSAFSDPGEPGCVGGGLHGRANEPLGIGLRLSYRVRSALELLA